MASPDTEKAQHKLLLLRLQGFFDALKTRELSDGESEDRGLRREADELAKRIDAALVGPLFGDLHAPAKPSPMSLGMARELVKAAAEKTARRPPPAKVTSVNIGGKKVVTSVGPGKHVGDLADVGQRVLHALEGTLDRKALAAALYLFQAPPDCTEFPRSWKGARKLLDVSSLGWAAAVRNEFAAEEGDGYTLLPLGQAACVLLLASGGKHDGLIGLTWADLLRCTAAADE